MSIMKNVYGRIAAVLAMVIGVMGVTAGGPVLLGRTPSWPVVAWLPVYNVAAGVITVLVTSILLWKNHRFAVPAALITLGLHTLVMIVLETVYPDAVAAQSLQAMTIRIATWLAIVGLLLLQGRRDARYAGRRTRSAV
jgi:uncharacterized membrane protein